jgi:hypothetical protein
MIDEALLQHNMRIRVGVVALMLVKLSKQPHDAGLPAPLCGQFRRRVWFPVWPSSDHPDFDTVPEPLTRGQDHQNGGVHFCHTIRPISVGRASA